MKWMMKAMPYLGVVILIGLIYDGVILYSRWHAGRQAAQANEKHETERLQRTVDAIGGGGLKILNFYASPPAIKSGESASLCYSVAGAKSVKLEPAVDEVWPALSRCLKVSPTADTEYKFTADDGAGHTASETVALKVQPAKPRRRG